jgi:hypothetical protein
MRQKVGFFSRNRVGSTLEGVVLEMVSLEESGTFLTKMSKKGVFFVCAHLLQRLRRDFALKLVPTL